MRAALEAAGGFRSAQQLHADLREGGASVGLTTVYRALQALSDAGEVDMLRTKEEALYRRCRGERHHHHLVCRRCGRSVEVGEPDLERWAAGVAGRHGFKEVTHTIEIFGVCSTCRF